MVKPIESKISVNPPPFRNRNRGWSKSGSLSGRKAYRGHVDETRFGSLSEIQNRGGEDGEFYFQSRRHFNCTHLIYRVTPEKVRLRNTEIWTERSLIVTGNRPVYQTGMESQE